MLSSYEIEWWVSFANCRFVRMYLNERVVVTFCKHVYTSHKMSLWNIFTYSSKASFLFFKSCFLEVYKFQLDYFLHLMVLWCRCLLRNKQNNQQWLKCLYWFRPILILVYPDTDCINPSKQTTVFVLDKRNNIPRFFYYYRTTAIFHRRFSFVFLLLLFW